MTKIDPLHFRNVLAAYPTGVCLIAAQGADGRKHAMIVGSFTSISLDPPLVGFFPAINSGTWAGMAGLNRFSVNVLSTDQLDLSRQFASTGTDKFDGIAHSNTPAGQPLIENAVAWFDCRTENVLEVGDHYFVIGRVEALGRAEQASPLLFHGGQYHSVGENVQIFGGAQR